MPLPKSGNDFLQRYDTFQPQVGEGQTSATENEGDTLLQYWFQNESQVKVDFEKKPGTETWDAKRKSIVETMRKFTVQKASVAK